MIQIKTLQDGVTRKYDVSSDGRRDVRITLVRTPEDPDYEDIKAISIHISKETFIQETRKFLEELKA